jgi:hypothetical protein
MDGILIILEELQGKTDRINFLSFNAQIPEEKRLALLESQYTAITRSLASTAHIVSEIILQIESCIQNASQK